MKLPLLILIAVLLVPVVCAYNLQYDLNGNLVSGDGKFRVYNAFNQLIEIRNGSDSSGVLMEKYEWHPVEDRILIKDVYSSGIWKETDYYVNKNFVQVENSSGRFNFTYVYQGGTLVAQVTPQGKQFILNDHLGSSTLVTDQFGTPIENTSYGPYGEILLGGSMTRFDYTGQEFNDGIGEYDYDARQFNPTMLRFTTPDKNIQNVYNPRDINPYTYARNSPFIYTDPTGKDAYLVLRDTNHFGANFGHLVILIENHDADVARGTYDLFEISGPAYFSSESGSMSRYAEMAFALFGTYKSKGNSKSGTLDAIFPQSYSSVLQLGTDKKQDMNMAKAARDYLAKPGNYEIFSKDSTTFIAAVLSAGLGKEALTSLLYEVDVETQTMNLKKGIPTTAKALYYNAASNSISIDKGKLQREKILSQNKYAPKK